MRKSLNFTNHDPKKITRFHDCKCVWLNLTTGMLWVTSVNPEPLLHCKHDAQFYTLVFEGIFSNEYSNSRGFCNLTIRIIRKVGTLDHVNTRAIEYSFNKTCEYLCHIVPMHRDLCGFFVQRVARQHSDAAKNHNADKSFWIAPHNIRT